MGTDARSPFATLLRQHRVAAGWSQERLAETAGLSLRAVSDLERGARRAPRLETVRMLADALGLAEDDRVAIFRAARAATTTEAAPTVVPSAAPVPARLPVSPTPLVGRERELGAVCALLDNDAVRLVTLTGPGGVGKTRLALAVAPRLETNFVDGVVFVSLAALSDAGLVVTAIADALGIQGAPGVNPQQALEYDLRDKRLLLVLDNFEHVLAAAPLVADLLAAASGLSVLATSRAPLRVRGERLIPVEPLHVPDADRSPALTEAANASAVQLFVARAQDIRPAFTLNQGNVRAVVEICRRLDGLPLALELAAARISVLPPQALLTRLERQGFLPRAGVVRDLPPRHRTLDAVIAWSEALLTPADQALFRRLAVFADGFTLEAAEAVVDLDGTLDVFEGIAGLVDANLLRSVEGFGGEARYAMLETVRDFAGEQVRASGEIDELGRRHVDYYTGLVRAGIRKLADASGGQWLARLEAEQGNVRAALAWLRDHGLVAEGLGLAADLGAYWRLRSAHAEGRNWLETFLTAGASQADPSEVRVTALRWAGELAGLEGDPIAAETRLGESLTLARRVQNRAGIAAALGAIASALVQRGDFLGSIPHFEEGAALARELGDRRQEAFLLAYLAFILGHQGDVARAEDLVARSATLLQSLGDTLSFEAVLAEMVQGWLAVMAGNHDRAVAPLELARMRSQILGSKAILSVTLAGLGEVAISRNQLQEAAAHFGEGLFMGWEGAFPVGIIYSLQGAVRAASRSGQPLRAARLAGALARFGETLGLLPKRVAIAYEADVTRLTKQLAPDMLATAQAEGRTLPLEDVVAEAMAVADAIASTQNAASAAPTSEGGRSARLPGIIGTLSPREVEVLRLVAAGKTDRDIADALFISNRTVSTHVTSIYAKLGVTNRVQAATLATKANLR